MEGTDDVPGNSWSEAGGLGWTLRKSSWFWVDCRSIGSRGRVAKESPRTFSFALLSRFPSLLDQWWRFLGAPVPNPIENPG